MWLRQSREIVSEKKKIKTLEIADSRTVKANTQVVWKIKIDYINGIVAKNYCLNVFNDLVFDN